jgi:hypothetical protein
VAAPSRVELTDHAQLRADRRGIGRDTIERVVLNGHASRRRNPGVARWRVEAAGIAVIYDHPAGGDATLALVRSAWRVR